MTHPSIPLQIAKTGWKAFHKTRGAYVTFEQVGILAGIAGGIAGIIQVVFAYLSYRSARSSEPRKPFSGWLSVGILAFLSWSGALYGTYEHARFNKPEGQFVKYGHAPPNSYSATVRFDDLDDLRHYKAVLITRTSSFINRDRLSDTQIAHSIAYNISSNFMTLGFVDEKGGMQFLVGLPNSIEFTLAILPNGIDVDQIRNLGDIDLNHGKILDTKWQDGVLGGRG